MFSEKQLSAHAIFDLLIKYALFFNVGCLFIAGFSGQFLYGLEISTCIGWSWSPFQYELAFSELSLAVLGLTSPLFHKEFWLATIIASAVWLSGASAVHIYYYVHGDSAIMNAGFAIAWNIFLATWLIVLYIARTLYARKEHDLHHLI
jgi:hypothetical protein